MSDRPTDHANLDLPQFHLDCVRGRTNGRIIWQPRIQCWHADKRFAGEPLPDPYDTMTIPEIFRSLGCSARLYQFNACFVEVEDPRVTTTRTQLNEAECEFRYSTPVGDQTDVLRATSTSSRPIHLKRRISCEEEMKIALWREERTNWRWDQAKFDAVMAEWGDLGAPTMYMPRTTIQHLYIDSMGVEDAIYATMEYPDTVAAFFEARNASHERLIEVINDSPIEIINFGDNLHAGTLPPYFYETYVLPAYQRRCELLHAGGKFVHSHWDGDCKALLPYARVSGLDGIEAITPKPQGDVTLDEVKDALGDDVWLIDGIPAVYFDEIYPLETLLDETRRVIELFAPNVILGISDEISSTGDIERVRRVGDLVDDYNASLGA